MLYQLRYGQSNDYWPIGVYDNPDDIYGRIVEHYKPYDMALGTREDFSRYLASPSKDAEFYGFVVDEIELNPRVSYAWVSSARVRFNAIGMLEWEEPSISNPLWKVVDWEPREHVVDHTDDTNFVWWLVESGHAVGKDARTFCLYLQVVSTLPEKEDVRKLCKRYATRLCETVRDRYRSDPLSLLGISEEIKRRM